MSLDQILTPDHIETYRRDGFVHIPGIISRDEAEQFRQAALAAAAAQPANADRPVFTQRVNVWQHNDVIKRLTLHPNLAQAALMLAGVPMRLWHDHTLIKQPHKSTPTEFHQDQPYWPHADSPHPLSAWVALCDVPVERGCMSFLPGSQARTDLPAQQLEDAQSLMNICPDLRWSPRVTLPLRAGDCTFHHGRCAHMATPNLTDEPRVAHVVIFMDEHTRYVDQSHVVTDPLDLREGDLFDRPLFPTADQIIAGRVG